MQYDNYFITKYVFVFRIHITYLIHFVRTQTIFQISIQTMQTSLSFSRRHWLHNRQQTLSSIMYFIFYEMDSLDILISKLVLFIGIIVATITIVTVIYYSLRVSIMSQKINSLWWIMSFYIFKMFAYWKSLCIGIVILLCVACVVAIYKFHDTIDDYNDRIDSLNSKWWVYVFMINEMGKFLGLPPFVWFIIVIVVGVACVIVTIVQSVKLSKLDDTLKEKEQKHASESTENKWNTFIIFSSRMFDVIVWCCHLMFMFDKLSVWALRIVIYVRQTFSLSSANHQLCSTSMFDVRVNVRHLCLMFMFIINVHVRHLCSTSSFDVWR